MPIAKEDLDRNILANISYFSLFFLKNLKQKQFWLFNCTWRAVTSSGLGLPSSQPAHHLVQLNRKKYILNKGKVTRNI
jgi:hypothetical protein